MRLPRSRLFYLALSAVVIAVLVLANAHMVVVAVSSQPECVDHVRTGELKSGTTPYGAARSAC